METELNCIIYLQSMKIKNSVEDYRKGPIGAILDEYEKALGEMKEILSKFEPDQYKVIVDSETKDENCRSVYTIMKHVCRAGLGYATSILEEVLEKPFELPTLQLDELAQVNGSLDKVFKFNEETLSNFYSIQDDEIYERRFKSHWGEDYGLEQMLEHAIVHILRHRRQLEKFYLILQK